MKNFYPREKTSRCQIHAALSFLEETCNKIKNATGKGGARDNTKGIGNAKEQPKFNTTTK